MAITTLIIEEGRIVEFFDNYHDFMENDNYYVGNGWEVHITDTSIKAVCTRVYSDGTHRIRVQVRDGRMKTVLTINGTCVWVKNKKCDYHGEGELGLSGGNVDDRYAFFRSNDFKQFLNKYNISAKYKLDYSNDQIKIFPWKTAINTYIYTDGTLEVSKQNFDYTSTSCVIKNATVVIEETQEWDGLYRKYRRILKSDINDVELLDKIIPHLDKYMLYTGYKFINPNKN